MAEPTGSIIRMPKVENALGQSATSVASQKAVTDGINQAKSAASTADGKAVTAQNTATAAQTAANEAKTAADNAQKTANEAKTAAGTAQTAANNANSNANGRVPNTRKVNGKPLSGDINLNAGDVGAGAKNTASKAQSGWWQCGDTGIIYQWGIYKRTGDHTKIKFPRAFPNKCFNVQLTLSVDDPQEKNISIYSVSNIEFDVWSWSHEVNGYWFAIGY